MSEGSFGAAHFTLRVQVARKYLNRFWPLEHIHRRYVYLSEYVPSRRLSGLSWRPLCMKAGDHQDDCLYPKHNSRARKRVAVCIPGTVGKQVINISFHICGYTYLYEAPSREAGKYKQTCVYHKMMWTYIIYYTYDVCLRHLCQMRTATSSRIRQRAIWHANMLFFRHPGWN